jgi:hypothetical protein
MHRAIIKNQLLYYDGITFAAKLVLRFSHVNVRDALCKYNVEQNYVIYVSQMKYR